MHLREILSESAMVLSLPSGTKAEILAALAETLCKTRNDVEKEELTTVLIHRESESSTAIADGIAIPHGRLAIGDEVLCGFGRTESGIDFDSVDGQPTKLFFMLVSPKDNPSLHVRWLGHIAGLLKNPALRADLLSANTAAEIMDRIAAEEDAQGGA